MKLARSLIILLLPFLLSTSTRLQGTDDEYVLNYSFESHNFCDDSTALCPDHWQIVGRAGFADSACRNVEMTQRVKPRDGKTLAYIYRYNPGELRKSKTNKLEYGYLIGKLSSPLIKNKEYKIETFFTQDTRSDSNCAFISISYDFVESKEEVTSDYWPKKCLPKCIDNNTGAIMSYTLKGVLYRFKSSFVATGKEKFIVLSRPNTWAQNESSNCTYVFDMISIKEIKK